MSAARDEGFAMPPDWAPHARCWMAWPCREAAWGGGLDEARRACADVAQAIVRFEPGNSLPHTRSNSRSRESATPELCIRQASRSNSLYDKSISRSPCHTCRLTRSSRSTPAWSTSGPGVCRWRSFQRRIARTRASSSPMLKGLIT